MRTLLAAVEAMRTQRPAALVTVIGVHGSTPRGSGTRMVVHADGTIVGTIGGGTIEHRVIEAAIEVIETGTPRTFEAHLTRDLGMCCGGDMSVWIEPLTEQPHLTVFGAGHVAHALVPMATAIGMAVTVVDDRDDLNTPQRFPVERVLTDPREAARHFPEGPHQYALIVTHDHALDQDLVQTLLPLRLAWLGMIGSRAKVTRFLIRLRAAGVPEDHLSRLCAPVGLDLGAETPAEIAVSIAAELVSVHRRSSGPAVPLSRHPIPARGGDGIAVPTRLRPPGRVSDRPTPD